MSTVISDSFGRFKEMSWFPKIHGLPVLVIGAGGIGSWLNLLLARAGANLYIYDFDHCDAGNLAGQLFKNADIRKSKVEAISAIISEFCDQGVEVEIFPERYVPQSPSNPIVLTALDNMSTRRLAFENWQKFLKDNPEEVKKSLFMDGRLSVEVIQIFCIKGDDIESQNKYEKEFLFSDEEVEEAPCTMRATSHIGAMIASHMIGFLTNSLGEEFRSVPFFWQYSVPIDLMTNDPF